MTTYDVVVPTVGRPSLRTLLGALADGRGPGPGAILLVNDRPGTSLEEAVPTGLRHIVRVLPGRGAGPAAARNAGWRASTAEWIAFLDDDVVPDPDWPARVVADLEHADPGVAGAQGRLRVPLPRHRPPTDWERNVAALERARWATADMAYRRAVLEDVGGFDERFPRAYREDADLALRVIAAGHRLVRGGRTTAHPVRPADRWVSLRLQAGNADDVLMRALHGRDWRRRAGAPRGRLPIHLASVGAALLGIGGLAAGRSRVAALGLGGWLVGTAELAWRRIRLGPRTPDEVATMLLTSAAMPFAAAGHWGAARVSIRRRLRTPAPQVRGAPAAVLLDRDGTIVVDVPYNGDPTLVRPVPGAREAVQRLRDAGIPLGVVSNQSAVGRGLISDDQLRAVNRRIEELLGPLGPWAVCRHRPDEGCRCRKPAPGLLLQAAHRLGVDPERCVVIGDTGADVAAAEAVGARPILVPNEATRPEEIEAAPEVATDLPEAVERVLGGLR